MGVGKQAAELGKSAGRAGTEVAGAVGRGFGGAGGGILGAASGVASLALRIIRVPFDAVAGVFGRKYTGAVLGLGLGIFAGVKALDALTRKPANDLPPQPDMAMGGMPMGPQPMQGPAAGPQMLGAGSQINLQDAVYNGRMAEPQQQIGA